MSKADFFLHIPHGKTRLFAYLNVPGMNGVKYAENEDVNFFTRQDASICGKVWRGKNRIAEERRRGWGGGRIDSVDVHRIEIETDITWPEINGRKCMKRLILSGVVAAIGKKEEERDRWGFFPPINCEDFIRTTLIKMNLNSIKYFSWQMSHFSFFAFRSFMLGWEHYSFLEFSTLHKSTWKHSRICKKKTHTLKNGEKQTSTKHYYATFSTFALRIIGSIQTARSDFPGFYGWIVKKHTTMLWLRGSCFRCHH